MSDAKKRSEAEDDIVRRISMIQNVGDLILDAHASVMEELIPAKNELRKQLRTATPSEAKRIRAEMDALSERIAEAYRAKAALAKGGNE